MQIEQLFLLAAAKKASDLLLCEGSPILLKINGDFIPVNKQEYLTGQAVLNLLMPVLSQEQVATLQLDKELNTGIRRPEIGTFRLSAFVQKGQYSAVFRYVPTEIPSMAALNLPATLSELVTQKRGLILVCGATGSGKSSTIASMIEARNQAQAGHILTIEDPIEFVFTPKLSAISQREVGVDSASMQVALKNALRQTPDLIFIGEIRDQHAMTAALTYAMSGHLVVSTLHANNSYHALSRILSMYPPESRSVLLSDMSVALKTVITQRLMRAVDGGRLPVLEVLMNTQLTADLIAENRLDEIKEAMTNSLARGSQTFEQTLLTYINAGKISQDEAMLNADSPTNLLWLLNNQGVAKSSAQAKAGDVHGRDLPSTYQEFNFAQR